MGRPRKPKTVLEVLRGIKALRTYTETEWRKIIATHDSGVSSAEIHEALAKANLAAYETATLFGSALSRARRRLGAKPVRVRGGRSAADKAEPRPKESRRVRRARAATPLARLAASAEP